MGDQVQFATSTPVGENIVFKLKGSCLPNDEELMKISEMQLVKRVVGDRTPQHTPLKDPKPQSESVINYEHLSPILRPSIIQELARELPETEERNNIEEQPEQRPEPDLHQNFDADIFVREIAEERRPNNLDQEMKLAARRVSIPFLFQYLIT